MTLDLGLIQVVKKRNLSLLIFVILPASLSLIYPEVIKFFDKIFTSNFHNFTGYFIISKSSRR
jgi:hypothetical protein